MSRRAARLCAVETLYAAELRGQSATDVLAERADRNEYAEHLVRGVTERSSEIHTILERMSRDWPPQRMSAIDRNILRVGVLELIEGDTPPAVVIDEAVEIAKRFSGEDAGRFVNGVLAGVMRERAAK